MRTIITVLLCAALALPVAADDLTVLESLFVLHSTLYREDGARYESARRAEEEAVRRVAALNTALDRSLVDQSVPVSELRRLEAELGEARAVALERSRQVTAERGRLYQRLDGLAELGAEIERQRDRGLVRTDELTGTWEVEVTPIEAFGVMEVRRQGTIVSGEYRMSTGAHGSLRGTFSGGIVKLERVDSVRGADVVLEGSVDAATGEVRGSWKARELARGSATSGTWTARKLAPGEAPPALP